MSIIETNETLCIVTLKTKTDVSHLITFYPMVYCNIVCTLYFLFFLFQVSRRIYQTYSMTGFLLKSAKVLTFPHNVGCQKYDYIFYIISWIARKGLLEVKLISNIWGTKKHFLETFLFVSEASFVCLVAARWPI